MASRRMRTAIGLIGSAALAIGLFGCAPGEEPEDEERVLRIAEGAPPRSFDAFDLIGTAGGGISGSAVYDSILILREGEVYEPWLAESYEYNDDHTVLTLEIRDDVTFIDGEQLNAEVIKQYLDIERTDGLDAAFYSAIEDVVLTGEYTVELHLSQPDSQLLLLLARRAVPSPAEFGNREGLERTPVGSGPYILESNDADSAYVFVRNEDYWNPEVQAFDRIELTFMEDTTARVNALKSGQVDFAQIDPQTAAEIESSGLEIATHYATWTGLVLGDRRGEIHPAIGDVRVRQAIMMALDREGYAETVPSGLGNASNQVGVEGQEGYFIPELADEFAYDPEAAKELLAEAGYPDGFDLQIPSPSWNGELQPYYDQALTDIGIRVEWVPLSDDAWFQIYLDGTYAVMPFGGLYPDLSLVRPDGQWNPWDNTDPELEEILHRMDTGDEGEWLEARTELTEKILTEGWFAIVTHDPFVYGFDPELDLTINWTGGFPAVNIQAD